MSIKAVSKVWEFSRQKGTNLLVLLAIADYAQDDGINAYPSYNRLGKKARLSRSGVMRAVDRLKASGELVVHIEAGAKTQTNRHTNSFDLVFQDGSNWVTIVRRCQKLKTSLPSEPQFNGSGHATIENGNSGPHATINSGPHATINSGPHATQNPSIETSIETSMPPDGGGQVLTDQEKDELLVFGLYGQDGKPAAGSFEEELENSRWILRGNIVALALEYFVVEGRAAGLPLPLPNSDSRRKDWHKSLAGHVDDFGLEGLKGKYKAVFEMAREGKWLNRIGRPGAIDKALAMVDNRTLLQAQTNGGPTLTPEQLEIYRQKEAGL